jgi:hypothetical protein
MLQQIVVRAAGAETVTIQPDGTPMTAFIRRCDEVIVSRVGQHPIEVHLLSDHSSGKFR